MAKNSKTKRIVRWVFTGVGIAVVAFLLVVLIMLAVDKFVKKSPVTSLFGVSFLTVSTGSMSGTIEEGDIVIIEEADEYKVGDIITFLPENATIPTTHRIIRIDGDLFYTKGDANDSDDVRPITVDKVFGKVTGRIRYVGAFFTWVANEYGWVYIVGAVLVVAAGSILLKTISKPDKEVKTEEETDNDKQLESDKDKEN